METLYEAMYIVAPDLAPEQEEEVLAGAAEAVTQVEGEVESNFVLGRRELTYEIAGQTSGVYGLMYFRGNGTVVDNLKRHFLITPEILRGIVVVANEKAIWSPEEPEEEEAEELEEGEPAVEEASELETVAEAPVEEQGTEGAEAESEAPAPGTQEE